ncbi:MAG: DegV family protein [Ruminococcaceae bacterium]|nr:DegV family protein [Oscillospiraceae bacterium]
MSEYVIFTDSACDIDEQKLKSWQVAYCSLSFTIAGEDKEYSNYDLAPHDFYEKMRGGAVAKTSAINTDSFLNYFEPILKEGKDLLYLGFSSGLSATFNCARMAAEELKEKYPERKIITIDTLCASAGQGLLVYLAVLEKEKGGTIEQVAEYVQGLVPNMCHWFTVDDLVYLKRGGRISPTVALVGSVLGIKPILHMDEEGHLISRGKARGRKAAIAALADKYGELAKKNAPRKVFLCQADCMDDAQLLVKMLGEKYKVDVDYIADIGPVIGAHAGPGTLAVFFIGENR